MSFSDASGMVCVRVEVSQSSESDASIQKKVLLKCRPYQTHQKRMWRQEIRRMHSKNAQDACRVHTALVLLFQCGESGQPPVKS